MSSAIAVNGATNQLTNGSGLSNVSYDSNGNLLSVTNAGLGTAMTLSYGEANRVASAAVGGGTEEWNFYGAQGERLGTCSLVLTCDDWSDPTTCYLAPTPLMTNVWFGGKLIWTGTGAAGTSGPAFTDRLGTNRADGARFRPNGDEITSTGNDREKFATYNRDGFTGLDYADQRYYASSYGRFNTPDPAYGGRSRIRSR